MIGYAVAIVWPVCETSQTPFVSVFFIIMFDSKKIMFKITHKCDGETVLTRKLKLFHNILTLANLKRQSFELLSLCVIPCLQGIL